jgi:metal-responsive CopG/Arc/MetJ family transcriptional regulator
MSIDPNTLLAITGVITAIGGGIATLQQVSRSFKKRREAYRRAIIDQAKEEMDLVKQLLEVKIAKIEVELENQKESVSKDLEHLKDSYSNEIQSLGEQIRSLRLDLQSQHSSLVSLLTRLVDNR